MEGTRLRPDHHGAAAHGYDASGSAHSNSPNNGAPPAYDHFMFNPQGSVAANNDELITKVDEIEALVEQLRSAAMEVEEEKVRLTKSLVEVVDATNSTALAAGHKHELDANIERIMSRLLAVDIRVSIPRTQEQEDAYHRVKAMLKDLQAKGDNSIGEYHKQLEAYSNACSSEAVGAADAKFQSLVLSCTLDDQKQVRKLLRGWMDVSQEIRRMWSQTRLTDEHLK